MDALKDSSLLVRCAAAEALGEIPDKRAVEPLSDLLNDEEGIGEAAAAALDRLAAARALGKIGDARAFAPLLAAFKKTGSWDFLEPMGHVLDRDAVDVLIGELGEEAGAGIACVLGDSGDTRAVRPLIELLDEWDDPKAREAAEALGKLGDPQAVPPLVNLLEKGLPPDIRKTAVEALGNLQDPTAVQPLIAMITSDDSMKWYAAVALGEIGDPRAIEPIKEMTRNIPKHDKWRQMAEEAMEKLGWQPRRPSGTSG